MTAAAPYLIYAAFGLGAFALYFLAPRAERRRAATTAGWLAAAAAGLAALLGSRLAGPHSGVLFYGFAVVALLAAVRVITHPRPVYSAIYFVVVVLAVAAILITYEAEFLAVALVIIYAGAILVTYLFVIMLAQQPGSPGYDRRAREPFLAVIAGFLLTGVVAGQVTTSRSGLPSPRTPEVRTAATHPAPAGSSAGGNTALIGVALMTRYPVALEIGGVLLLISMVGAVALSHKRIPVEGVVPPAPELGRIGKEVEPF